MKRPVKTKTKRDAKRDLFVELSEGMKALAEERLGKRTLRTYLQNKPGGQFMKDDVITVSEFELDDNG